MRAAVPYSKVSHFSDELVSTVVPIDAEKGHVGEYRSQRHLFWTLARDGVSGQVHVVMALLLGKYPRS